MLSECVKMAREGTGVDLDTVQSALFHELRFLDRMVCVCLFRKNVAERQKNVVGHSCFLSLSLGSDVVEDIFLMAIMPYKLDKLCTWMSISWDAAGRRIREKVLYCEE